MKKNRLAAMLLAIVIMVSLSGCTLFAGVEVAGVDMSIDLDEMVMFIGYGWDGLVNGETIWENKARAEAEAKKAAEEAAKLAGEEVTDEASDTEEVEDGEEETEVVTEVVTEKNAKGETVTKVVEKTVTKQSSGGSSSSGSKTNGGSTSGGSTSGGSTSGGSTSGGSTTATDALSVFNNAVNAGKPTSCTYSVSSASVSYSGDSTMSKLAGSFTEDSDVAKQNRSGVSGSTSGFSTIASGDVASSSIKDNGSTYTITIKLNNASLGVNSSPCQKGYEYFMAQSELLNTIHLVNANMIMQKVSGSYIALSNGSITATVNKSTGKFTSVKLTLHEKYYDKADTESFLDADTSDFIKNAVSGKDLYCTFDYDLSVDFAF